MLYLTTVSIAILAVANEMTIDKRMIAFGKCVRELRKGKGISQERLAEMAGID